jgi:hypothetical protein
VFVLGWFIDIKKNDFLWGIHWKFIHRERKGKKGQENRIKTKEKRMGIFPSFFLCDYIDYLIPSFALI